MRRLTGIELPQRHPDAPVAGTRLGNHYPACFGCGSEHPAGLHLQLLAGDDVSVTAEYSVTQHHQGAAGFAHGGLLACAVDETMAGLFCLLRRPAVTAGLDTTFRRPVPVGSRLVIKARATGIAGRKVFTEAEARFAADPDGAPAITATGVFVFVAPDYLKPESNSNVSPSQLSEPTDVHP